MLKFAILPAAAAAAFLFVGGNLIGSDTANATCSINTAQENAGWVCDPQVISSETVNVWIKAGDSDQCRFGPVTQVVTQDVALNPNGNPVPGKSGDESTGYTNIQNPGGQSTNCSSLPAGSVIVTKQD